MYPLLKDNDGKWKRSNGDFVVVEEGANGKGIKNTARMIRSTQYKYVKYYSSDVEQLFDMVKDSGEMVNLATQESYRPIIAQHRDMLKKWENSLTLAPRAVKAGIDKWRNL